MWKVFIILLLLSYESNAVSEGDAAGCPPLSADITAPKTGQKAWDKCIEYQEKLVYPCESSPTLHGEKKRVSKCQHGAEELILGGSEAKPHEFPYAALLGYGTNRSSIEWLCTGSLISERFVLTAAHCISHREKGPTSYVFVGGYKRSETSDLSKVYDVKTVYSHPEHKVPTIYNDIALLELVTDIPLSEFIVPACLHTGDPVNDSRVTGTGWGRITHRGTLADTIKKVVLSKVSTSECSAKYPEGRRLLKGFDEVTQLCYAPVENDKDMCQGDGGGAIQVKSDKIKCMYVIVGVTSTGKVCGITDEPSLYTKVAHYLPWIESIVWP